MNYRIMHTVVGPWSEGRVVGELEMKSIKGIDIKRLRGLGAIQPTVDEITPEPTPVGPENMVPPPPTPENPQETSVPAPGMTVKVPNGTQPVEEPAPTGPATTRQTTKK